MFPPGKKKYVTNSEELEFIDIPDDEDGDELEDEDEEEDEDDDEGVGWGLWDGIKAIAEDWWNHGEEE